MCLAIHAPAPYVSVRHLPDRGVATGADLPLDFQTLADDLPFHLPPTQLTQRLGALIRRYVAARSAELADTIARHLQALYLHPTLRDAPEQEAYRAAARHWRLLAAAGRHPVTNT